MMKKEDYTKILYKFFCASIFLVIVITFVFWIYPYYVSTDDENDNTKVEKADGFTIESFNVILDVNEDNKIDVTECITVNWIETDHHGIYRVIPKWLKYTGQDNKTIKRKSNILNVATKSEISTIETVNKKIKLKIGNDNQYVDPGEKQYTIFYTYDMGKDPYKGFDEFIFHLYGDYWGTELKNASFQINMPKSIDGCNINFFNDKYRKNNINDCVSYVIEGNTLYANYDCIEKESYVPLNKALTVDIELPEGYFEDGSNNYGNKSFVFIIIIFVLTLITVIRWIIYGKGFKKTKNKVEPYPPENYDAAEIGYIYAKNATKKLTIALIIQLACKGYIKIDELKDYKKNIKITNLCQKPIKTGKEQYTKDLEIYNNKISKLQELSEFEKKVYDKLLKNEKEIILSRHKTLYSVFDSINTQLTNKFKYLIFDKKSQTKKIISIVATILVLVLHIFAYAVIEDLNPDLDILYVFSFMCIFVNIFFTILMKRKTSFGEEIVSRVLGFRDFLLKADNSSIDNILLEHPQYFYDILPYAYVLNISKVWTKKFKDIQIPINNMGQFDYTSNIDSLYDNIPYPVSSNKNNNGGCSSCGGGCSSCGGGGSW